VVVLTDIYPAGEAPLPGVTLEALADAVRPAVAELHVVPRLEDVPASVARLSRPGDLIVTLGAGSVGQVGDRLLDLLGREGRR
jgi:UDP-N-acetylmuramate--alanine ligase